jgi:hypothetical protein
MSDDARKYRFIGCEIIYREACLLAARSRHMVDVSFLRKGLHDLETAEMLARLQRAVDEVDPADGYEAILLGYARCNDGLVGLRAGHVPLVIPRAHDCITFFFGGRANYHAYFDERPGTYFRTTGWSERDGGAGDDPRGVMNQLGLGRPYQDMVARYGKENADYIMEQMGGWQANYDTLCYVEMGVCDERPHVEGARDEAQRKGWAFERREGDWSLLERLFEGPWDEDFVIVRPGHRLVARNDGRVLDAE